MSPIKTKIIPYDCHELEPTEKNTITLALEHIPRRGDMIHWQLRDTIYRGFVATANWDITLQEVRLYIEKVEAI